MSSRPIIQFARRFSQSSSRKVATGIALFGAGATFVYAYKNEFSFPSFVVAKPNFPIMTECKTKFDPQSSVINDTKNHALYLTIHLSKQANAQDCLKALGGIQKNIDQISPPDMRDESDEIWYGVGFGPAFLEKVKPDAKKSGVVDFNYRERRGNLGDLPSTGGDIFIHAKCHERGKLFELAQSIIHSLPANSVAQFEDIYGWVYRGGRDLSGFIDGTENPADPDERIEVAIDKKTGGSYVVTQKWIHDHNTIRKTADNVKSNWIGREITDSTEQKKKTITSHVARMVGSAEIDAPAKFQIVRHSQPWGTVSKDSGLFFIAYSSTPEAFDWMLDRMTGLGGDKHCDDVMRMTRCVTGNYWYFPSQSEFDRMTGAKKSGFW